MNGDARWFTVLGKKKGHQSFVSKFTMRKVFDETIGHMMIKTETHKLLIIFSFARHIRKYEQFGPKKSGSSGDILLCRANTCTSGLDNEEKH